jgi:hypothetical protein
MLTIIQPLTIYSEFFTIANIVHITYFYNNYSSANIKFWFFLKKPKSQFSMHFHEPLLIVWLYSCLMLITDVVFTFPVIAGIPFHVSCHCQVFITIISFSIPYRCVVPTLLSEKHAMRLFKYGQFFNILISK